MKVHLICYEDLSSWILGKLTSCLADELRTLGVDVGTGQRVDPRADINHHVIYTGFAGSTVSRHTVMITHVDTSAKLEQLRSSMSSVDMGICLSSDTVDKLVTLGLPRGRLCYVNYPSPQAGNIAPRQIHVGITSRCYAHGSKREYLLGELARYLPAGMFAFHIMGDGWEAVVHELRRRGSEVFYEAEFHEQRYRALWGRLDYYLYLGQDEGSTGLLDALEAGVPTIATPQGFHLDLTHGVTHAVNDFADLQHVFAALAQERQRLRAAVSSISWHAYATKHLEIWREVIARPAGARTLCSMGSHPERGPPSSERVRWRVPAMPTGAGPGGAVHRPRLLVLTDGEPKHVIEHFREAGALAYGMPRVLAAELGTELDVANFREAPHLEVRVTTPTLYPLADIPLLSLDFDAVALWNMAPFASLGALSRPWKPNYIMRSSLLERVGRLATASASPRLATASGWIFSWIRRLQLQTSTKLVGFMIGDEVYDRICSTTEESALQAWWSKMAMVAYTDPRWARVLAMSNPHTRHIRFDQPRLPAASDTPSPWQGVLELLFETMAQPRDTEQASPALQRLRRAQRAAHRFRSP